MLENIPNINVYKDQEILKNKVISKPILWQYNISMCRCMKIFQKHKAIYKPILWQGQYIG